MINTLNFENIVLFVLGTILPLLLTIAFYTVTERKIIAAVQRRSGPNVTGTWGLLQAFADGLKLFVKEVIIPSKANTALYLLAPITIFSISLLNWAFIPFSTSETVSDFKYGMLGLIALSSLSVYGIIFAGWSSNSRYPFIGAIRSAAQIISYELSLTFIIIIILLFVNSLNFTSLVMAQLTLPFIVLFFPLFIMFGLTILAETNRAPFDLPEAEAEIVAGYNLEYSSIPFALFFLGEYSNIILISTLITLLFLGGWPFIVNKILFICFLYILVRATLPRLRYDQLIMIGWKIFLPLLLGYLLITIGLTISFTNYTEPTNFIEYSLLIGFFTIKNDPLDTTPPTPQLSQPILIRNLIVCLTVIGILLWPKIALQTNHPILYNILDTCGAYLIYLLSFIIQIMIELIGTLILGTINFILFATIPFFIATIHFIIIKFLYLFFLILHIYIILVLGFLLSDTFPFFEYIAFRSWEFVYDTYTWWSRCKVVIRRHAPIKLQNWWREYFAIHFELKDAYYQCSEQFFYKFWCVLLFVLYAIPFYVLYAVLKYVIILPFFVHIGWNGFIWAFITYSIAYILHCIHPAICPNYLLTTITDYVILHLTDPKIIYDMKDSVQYLVNCNNVYNENYQPVFRATETACEMMRNITAVKRSAKLTDEYYGCDNDDWHFAGVDYLYNLFVDTIGIRNLHTVIQAHVDVGSRALAHIFSGGQIAAVTVGIKSPVAATLVTKITTLTCSYTATKLAVLIKLIAGANCLILQNAVLYVATINEAIEYVKIWDWRIRFFIQIDIKYIINNILLCINDSGQWWNSISAIENYTITGSKLHITSNLFNDKSRIADGEYLFKIVTNHISPIPNYCKIIIHGNACLTNKKPLDLDWEKVPAILTLIFTTRPVTTITHKKTLLSKNTKIIFNFIQCRYFSFGKTRIGRKIRFIRWLTKTIIRHLKEFKPIFKILVWFTTFVSSFIFAVWWLKTTHNISFIEISLYPRYDFNQPPGYQPKIHFYWKKVPAILTLIFTTRPVTTITHKKTLLSKNTKIIFNFIQCRYFSFFQDTRVGRKIRRFLFFGKIKIGRHIHLFPYFVKTIIIRLKEFKPIFKILVWFTTFVSSFIFAVWWLKTTHNMNLEELSFYTSAKLQHVPEQVFIHFSPAAYTNLALLTPEQLRVVNTAYSNHSSTFYHSIFNAQVCAKTCPRSIITYNIIVSNFPCAHPGCCFPFVHGHREHWTYNPYRSAAYYTLVPIVSFIINWCRFIKMKETLSDNIELDIPVEIHLMVAGTFAWNALIAVQALYRGDYMWIDDPHVPIFKHLLIDSRGNDLCAHCLKPVFDRHIHKLVIITVNNQIISTALLKFPLAFTTGDLSILLSE
jgi:NADH-quinone oxidoreductase subunit H